MDGNQTPCVNMDEVNQYYDHYKDTFSLQKEYLGKRDKLTLFLLLAAIVLIGLIVSPSDLGDKLNTIIKAQVENLSFDISFINSGVILVTFWYLLQYYMIVLQIEKMYKYIAETEKLLSQATPSFPINREGAYYLKSYPWLKDIADYIFVLGVPLGFITLSIFKIINECSWTSPLKIVDFVFLVLIIIFSLLYISNRKFHEEYFDKNKFCLNRKQRFAGYFCIKTYQSVDE